MKVNFCHSFQELQRPSRDANIGPPTLTTQLPYKIDEDDSNELLTSTA